MCCAKGRLWPAIAHLLAMSLRSLLQHFAPPTNANYALSSLFAKANIGFRLFAASLGPRACGPAVRMKSPSPSSLGARCLLIGSIVLFNTNYFLYNQAFLAFSYRNKTQCNLHIGNRTFYINSYRIPYDSAYLNSNLHNTVYHQIRICNICTFIPYYSVFSLSPFFLKSLRPF